MLLNQLRASRDGPTGDINPEQFSPLCSRVVSTNIVSGGPSKGVAVIPDSTAPATTFDAFVAVNDQIVPIRCEVVGLDEVRSTVGSCLFTHPSAIQLVSSSSSPGAPPHFMSCSADGVCVLWSAAQRRPLQSFSSALLAAASFQWDVPSNFLELRRCRQHQSTALMPSAATLSAPSDRIVVGNNSGATLLIDTSCPYQPLFRSGMLPDDVWGPVTATALSSSSTLLASMVAGGVLLGYDTRAAPSLGPLWRGRIDDSIESGAITVEPTADSSFAVHDSAILVRRGATMACWDLRRNQWCRSATLAGPLAGLAAVVGSLGEEYVLTATTSAVLVVSLDRWLAEGVCRAVRHSSTFIPSPVAVTHIRGTTIVVGTK